MQTLLFDQFTVVNKASASDPWEFTTASFDAANFVLGSGVVNISTTEILDATQITTELNGVVILKGTAFIIKDGGDWGQYTGDRAIPDNSIIMATVDGPSIANDPNNQDWFLFTENLLNASQVALLDNFVQDGITFQASRNIEIDPSNVDTFEAIATGTPIVRQIGGNTPGQNRSIVYTDVPLQMPDLVGGRLTLSIEFEIQVRAVCPPAWTFMRIEYPGGIQFDFPLQGAPINGFFTQPINIPSVSYIPALNQNATVRLFYNFSGVSWNGEYTINGLINTSTGSLHDSVLRLAETAAQQSATIINTRIDTLVGDIDEEGNAIADLDRRASPYRDDQVNEPYVNTRWLDSTGSDNPPTDIGAL